jgi:hypothetical protein
MKTLQGVISVLLIMILALSMSGCSNLAQIFPPLLASRSTLGRANPSCRDA